MQTLLRAALLPAFLLATAPARAAVVCPGPNAVWGIDVSEWQGQIDWNQVKGGGKEFAIIRVSDGTGHFDPTFDRNWAEAKQAGLIRGAYQFFEPGGDAVAQANLLLQHMGPIGPGDLPPMIDVEATGGQSPATITRKIHEWLDTVQNATGRKGLIYTGGWFWNPDVGSGDFVDYPLVDSYYCDNCCPNIAVPWARWAMWQYSSSGRVPGIGGNVDLDRFDGTMADLEKLAGGSPDWSASYVSQSWPLASSALNLTVNQTVPADMVLKNTGRKGWDASTRLGTTQPRDRPSAFAGADWIGPHRPAACVAGAAPGGDCKFAFHFHAPSTPGDYHEFFSVVQEGVAWFSDPGQGGPPDNLIEAWIHVSEADYHGQFASQSYPLAPGGAKKLALGERSDGWIELKNIGTQPWKAGRTRLAPIPRDQACPFAGPDWLSATRVSTVDKDVPPGAVGRFPLSLIGAEKGDHPLRFALVEEGVTWFADAPAGGGPADDLLQVRLLVADSGGVDPPGGTPDGGVASPTKQDPAGHPSAHYQGQSSASEVTVQGGCALAAKRGNPAFGLFLLPLIALVIRRRRA